MVRYRYDLCVYVSIYVAMLCVHVANLSIYVKEHGVFQENIFHFFVPVYGWLHTERWKSGSAPRFFRMPLQMYNVYVHVYICDHINIQPIYHSTTKHHTLPIRHINAECPIIRGDETHGIYLSQQLRQVELRHVREKFSKFGKQFYSR